MKYNVIYELKVLNPYLLIFNSICDVRLLQLGLCPLRMASNHQNGSSIQLKISLFHLNRQSFRKQIFFCLSLPQNMRLFVGWLRAWFY